MNAPAFIFRLGCAMIACSLAAQAPNIPELAALTAQFDARVKLEVQQPYDTSVADLNAKYIAALDRVQQSAQQAGRLDDALAVKNEKEAVATGKGVPSNDEDTTLLTIKQLRDTYRGSIGRLDIDRSRRLQPLQADLGKSLDALIANLTKQSKLQEALVVKQQRDMMTVATPAMLGASKKSPFVNSLGMKFVPVPETAVLFCIHETRYKDYVAYASEAPGVDGTWKDQSAEGFTPTENKEDNPVASVTWDEAQAFCAWLSRKEGRTYRLPTDREWSVAVGLGKAEKATKDATPKSLNSNVTDHFPWEDVKWPPPKGAGNYSDESRKTRATPPTNAQFFDHNDGYPTTAPVMSFRPNKLGLHDLGGNLWEWCGDWYDGEKKSRVLRGGAWFDAQRQWEISSCRLSHPPGTRKPSYGFRVVLESGPAAR